MVEKQIQDLYENYRQNRLDRRGFLKKLARLAGGTAAAVALLPILESRTTRAQKVAPKDDRIAARYTRYPAGTGEIKAYLARPRGEAPCPAVVVIHENRGLQPHIEDVARRLAVAGYLALAPDALTPEGGTPADPDAARDRMRKLNRETTHQHFIAAVHYLKTHPQTTGKVACMGFCWGGGVTNQVAVHSPGLDVAVPFYGSQPNAEEVPRIKASLLCHYAGEDPRINAGIPDFEAALKEAGIEYRIFMYEGARHAFFNDTRPERYHPQSARLAWERTLDFFKEKLV